MSFRRRAGHGADNSSGAAYPVPMRRTPNPVLPGSHPDPSVVRVGDDYYLATSTFEWSPGVRVHHSRDLVTWRPLGGVLDGRHLDLTGCPDSGGVWAPNLSHADGLFHLVYSNVSTYLGGSGDDVQGLCAGRIVSVLAPTSRYAEPFVRARASDFL